MSYQKNRYPLVSVIMPVYNAEKYLRESIDSILRQTYLNFEFIIINDGSTDSSQIIIDYYKKIDSRIIAIKQDNKGVVSAVNNAIKLAKGVYLSRADADDVSFDHKISELVECAINNPKAIVICGSIEIINERSEFIYRDLVLTKNEDLKRALYLRNPIPNGSTLIKKTAIDKVGGYDDVFAEDCHMWTKLYNLGDFISTGTIVYRWRMNSTGLTLSNKDKSVCKEKEYLEKIWQYKKPDFISRKKVIERSKFYQNNYDKVGVEYKRVFLFDLARLSVKLVRRGFIWQGLCQLFVIASTGRTGLGIVKKRLFWVGQSYYDRVIIKITKK
jgi:glycosyltransferase involved in cell wall biosynthesis